MQSMERCLTDPQPEIPMKSLSLTALAAGLAFVASTVATPSYAAVDADAAQKLAKKSDCFKCHAVDKSKKGPSLKKIAEKYKGKPDAQEKAIKNFTTSPKVKLDDGTEEEHPVVKTKDQAEMKNLADWILSQ
jgi:cytochrome c